MRRIRLKCGGYGEHAEDTAGWLGPEVCSSYTVIGPAAWNPIGLAGCRDGTHVSVTTNGFAAPDGRSRSRPSLKLPVCV